MDLFEIGAVFRLVFPTPQHEAVHFVGSFLGRGHPVPRVDFFSGFGVTQAAVRGAASGENFPAENPIAPDVAQGRVFAEI